MARWTLEHHDVLLDRVGTRCRTPTNGRDQGYRVSTSQSIDVGLVGATGHLEPTAVTKIPLVGRSTTCGGVVKFSGLSCTYCIGEFHEIGGETRFRADDTEVEKASGANKQAMHEARFNLKPYVDKKMFLRIVDQSTGAWVHAYLHRKEGDQWNANYWYRRAGRSMSQCSLDEEWEEIVKALL